MQNFIQTFNWTKVGQACTRIFFYLSSFPLRSSIYHLRNLGQSTYGQKMLKIVGIVTYFVPFRSWLKRTLLKLNLILQRCMIFLCCPTSLLQICRGRYLQWSMQIWKLYSLNTSCLDNIYMVMYWRLKNILCNSCLCEEVGSKWREEQMAKFILIILM